MDQLNSMKIDLNIMMKNSYTLTTPHSTNNDQIHFINLCNQFNPHQHNYFETHTDGHTINLICKTLDSLLITSPVINTNTHYRPLFHSHYS